MNFRSNLHFGGVSHRLQLSAAMEEFCHRVMERGQFPYAHLDLFLCPDGEFFLNEINLCGGLRGATIEKKKYHEIIDAIQKENLRALQSA